MSQAPSSLLGRISGRGAILREEAKRRTGGIRGKLWLAFVMQIVAISLATLLGVYGASYVLRDVLIQHALTEEARHYWGRVTANPAAELPDTYNMQGLMRRNGQSFGASGIPESLAVLGPGYHRVKTANGRQELVFVSDGPPGRLYLIFAEQQVDKLAFWFGAVPLSIVLLLIYGVSFITYRRARRAVSPIIWLANRLRGFDLKNPQLDALDPALLPREADSDVRFLAKSLHGFATRIDEFIDRERNFTRDASHELRSPLTVIKVAADVLSEDGALEPFGERAVARIRRAVRDMEALIEAFLILAREADQGLPEEDFVVNDAAAEEIDRARDLLAGKPVEIHFQQDAQFALHAPPRVFAVLVSNLLRNACAYTEQGSVTLTVGKDFVRVDDTGVGMSPADLERVGQPFFRGAQTGKGGHGVGLTIVKRLADRFNWRVSLESRLGVGTRATIRFPNPQAV